jgi:hypothetical protein
MAQATPKLIDALRGTALRLEQGADYAWGNHGACNCGNLLQVVTSMDKTEILRLAHTGIGEWTELAEEYCPVSNLPADRLVGELMKQGLTPTDIHHIEYLDDRDVLERLPGGFRWLQRNNREDVVHYMRAMAAMLEERMELEHARSAVRQILDEMSESARHLEASAVTL